ncbi:MAG: hypothetical protein LBH44_07670 [Treponema sp.]|jgi:hypothetical protein|nr:hypothetical protein [Treponema sp.]
MVVYQDGPVTKNAEVVHPGHPAIIDTGLLVDKTAKLKSGTILKFNAAGDALQAAAPADTPIGVLAQDSDGINAEVLVLWHGMVVKGRLLDSSGANPAEATAAMTAKLRTAGIYPVQLFTSAKKG